MKKILLIHGPNLNCLGKRDQDQYGALTLRQLEKMIAVHAKLFDAEVYAHQSNHEGDLIDILQQQSAHCNGIIINPGAFCHYSIALHDALLDTGLPAVEVHLSDITKREVFRRKSLTAQACLKMICGKKEKGYEEAVNFLIRQGSN